MFCVCKPNSWPNLANSTQFTLFVCATIWNIRYWRIALSAPANISSQTVQNFINWLIGLIFQFDDGDRKNLTSIFTCTVHPAPVLVIGCSVRPVFAGWKCCCVYVRAVRSWATHPMENFKEIKTTNAHNGLSQLHNWMLTQLADALIARSIRRRSHTVCVCERTSTRNDIDWNCSESKWRQDKNFSAKVNSNLPRHVSCMPLNIYYHFVQFIHSDIECIAHITNSSSRQLYLTLLPALSRSFPFVLSIYCLTLIAILHLFTHTRRTNNTFIHTYTGGGDGVGGCNGSRTYLHTE